MRMVVTGRDGQVVRSLLERGSDSPFEIIALGRPELDLAGPEAKIISAVEAARPDVIVSAAAYTQVDKAESEPAQAFAVNSRAPAAIAQAAAGLRVPVLHLSTDYVFDGMKTSPYVETDATAPQCVYGVSKLEGEHAVSSRQPNCAILRTAWIYSPYGANFVKTMLRLAGDRDEVGVVADQWGNPTSAIDLADGILAVASNLLGSDHPSLRGVFHMSAAGDASWAQFAEAIFATSMELGGAAARVKHIRTLDYPTAAKRPANSRLDCSKLSKVHNVRLPDWHQSLKEVVARLVRNGA